MAQDKSQPERPLLKPEAQAALHAATQVVPQEVRAQLNAPTMNRIHRAVAGISMDRLRLMMADGSISAQEARMALSQEGLSAEEIEVALEYTRQVLEHYVRGVVKPEHSLASIGERLNKKVKRMGELLALGAILPGIAKQSKQEPLSPSAPARPAIEPDGKKR